MRLILIIILFGLNSFAFGQVNKESQSLIQMCIDLDDLQQYYHKDKVEERKPLIIFNNGIVPANLSLVKFGESVQFMTREGLFFNNIKAYLDFAKFEISSSKADIEFHYQIEGLTVLLTFEKNDGKWVIKTKKLIEN